MIRLNAHTGFEGIRGVVRYPEQKETKTGKKFLKFQISTYDGKNRETGKSEYSNWSCTMWSEAWIPEGTRLLVTECAIKNRKYEDKDGKKRTIVDMTVYRCEEIPESDFFGGYGDSGSFKPLPGGTAAHNFKGTAPAVSGVEASTGEFFPESFEQTKLGKIDTDGFVLLNDDEDLPFA